MRKRAALRRFLFVAAALPAMVGVGWSQVPEPGPQRPLALLADIEGPIGPGTAHHVARVVAIARERNAEILVLRLNTPGGLASSMRDVIARILSSSVPVAGYVAPPGAHAASAGTYILYATHVAAMAPGTNIGAATPVQIGGLPGMPPGDKPGSDGKSDEKQDSADNGDTADGKDTTKAPARSPADTMTAKATNDAVAFIRGLAEMHGRNADWAERAVREAASLSAGPALEAGVIDIVAGDVDALLAQADGRRVIAGSAERTLATKGARVERIEAGFLTRALSLLSNPNIAFILLMIGLYGLIFEFANPGSIGPGVIGAICLVLGFYALNQLPLDFAGLALVVFGIALMVAEAFTPTFGVFGVGGLAAFVIGSAMLIDTEVPAYRLSWWTIGGVAASSGAILVLLLGYTWRVYRRPAGHGRDAMLGNAAQVLDWSDGSGHVWARSERWAARGARDFAAGETVEVRDVDGLTLVVGPESSRDSDNTDNDGG